LQAPLSRAFACAAQHGVRLLVIRALMGLLVFFHVGPSAAQLSDAEPWSLLAMSPAEAEKVLVDRGYKCAVMRAYIPPNEDGIRHLTFLRCEMPTSTSSCRIVQMDITEEKPKRHGVSYLHDQCKLR
jgi:hypothetical protein